MELIGLVCKTDTRALLNFIARTPIGSWHLLDRALGVAANPRRSFDWIHRSSSLRIYGYLRTRFSREGRGSLPAKRFLTGLNECAWSRSTEEFILIEILTILRKQPATLVSHGLLTKFDFVEL
mgnify:CR=1 FL=1